MLLKYLTDRLEFFGSYFSGFDNQIIPFSLFEEFLEGIIRELINKRFYGSVPSKIFRRTSRETS